MDAEPARLIIEALKEEKIDLYVTLPGGTHGSLRKRCKPIPTSMRDGGLRRWRVALTAGAAIAGRRAVFVTGVAGLLKGGLALMHMGPQYGIPVFILASYRGDLGDGSGISGSKLQVFRQVGEPFLQALRIPYQIVGERRTLKRTIRDAHFMCRTSTCPRRCSSLARCSRGDACPAVEIALQFIDSDASTITDFTRPRVWLRPCKASSRLPRSTWPYPCLFPCGISWLTFPKRRVVAIDGDGRCQSYKRAASSPQPTCGPANLTAVVFDNGVYGRHGRNGNGTAHGSRQDGRRRRHRAHRDAAHHEEEYEEALRAALATKEFRLPRCQG